MTRATAALVAKFGGDGGNDDDDEDRNARLIESARVRASPT